MSQLDSSLSTTVSSVGAVRSRSTTPWRWLLVASTICAAMGAAAVSSFLWLLSVPTAPDCQQLSSLSPDVDRLYCSQIAAASGNVEDLLAGLDLIAGWPETHPLYTEAQNWLREWSDDILAIAHQAVREGDLEQGRQLSQRIPANSPSYADAMAAVAEWDETWSWGEGLMAEAEDALKAGNWGGVVQVIQVLRQSEYRYWRSDQPQTLTSRMQVEKAAQQQQQEVMRLAQSGRTADLRQALTLSQQIDPDTYVWVQLQDSLNQWGDRLLEQGRQEWYALRLDDAMAMGKLVTDIPALAVHGHDLVILSRARQRATASVTNWEPTIAHLWELNRAIATAKAITPESRFYPQAAASIASWQVQLQDLSQLYQAQLAADGDDIAAYQTAIARAATIEPGHLRRQQAQTLTAYWQREIERIEDAPVLRQARRIAKSGGVGQLQSAIARAGQIQPDRALYGEAQEAIARWTAQIQTIEDRPILDRAERYAVQGQLRRAIQEASLVGAGRALAPEARALQRRWQGRIDAARPRPKPAPSAPGPVLESDRAVTEPGALPAPPASPSAEAPAASTVSPEMPTPVLVPAPPALGQPREQPQGNPAQPDGQPQVNPTQSTAPPAGVFPGETPATLVPAPNGARFSNEFVDEAGRPTAEPAAPAPEVTAPPTQPPAAQSRRPQPSDPAVLGPSAAQPSPPEVISLPPESFSAAPAIAFLDDDAAFPLLYAGSLFVL